MSVCCESAAEPSAARHPPALSEERRLDSLSTTSCLVRSGPVGSLEVWLKITIAERGATLRTRLGERLQLASELRCTEHDENVDSVSIQDRENGWFDALWTTCCHRLETAALSIVGSRC